MISKVFFFSKDCFLKSEGFHFLSIDLYKVKTLFNPFPNKPWFLHVCSTSLLKTMWEKEKLLVKSNFFFSHSVIKPFEELSSISIKSEIVVCKLNLEES